LTGAEISLFSESDIAGCVEVFRRAFREPPWEEEWPEAVARRRLGEILDTPNALGVVARDEGVVLGFVLGFTETFHPSDRFQLAEMAVAPDRQRQGLGSALIVELGNRLQTTSVDHVYLITGRRGPTREFWNALQFRESDGRIVMVRATRDRR
jgi:aminoglycoside 6'-N-acetyltransferase I